MNRRKRTLSIDDQKAIDVILNQAAGTKIKPLTEAVSPARIGAVSKLLSLLNQLPEIKPPADLMAKTMQRIDQDAGRQIARESHTGISRSAHLH